MKDWNPSGCVVDRALSFLAFLLVCVQPVPAHAHHSFAMYDSTRIVTLQGTVKSFEWSNPHIILWVYAAPSGAALQLWSLELSSPANVIRQGWTRHSLQPGDKVVVELEPLRNGAHGGSLKRVTTASGVVLTSNSIIGVVRPAVPQKSPDAQQR
ncbi:MAG TPA: DUF6152 family protein [Steroidobacteraceae bacterium]|nr:DUF6152 family protein [Steroidobacteraceae bacterium]